VTVPDEVRDRLKAELWKAADEMDWMALSPNEKSQKYENWAQDSCIGGTLSHYMDVRQIRQYIKDTLLKKYPQARHADAHRPLQLLGIDNGTGVAKTFIRPHGLQLLDGRVICWGRAADWKSVLMAAHERAFQSERTTPHGVVLLRSSAKFGTIEARRVVIDAAEKLGVQQLIWHG
jgi:hypothetical protein